MATLKREVGDTVGGYRVLARLGTGGSGSVYRVADPGGAQFALKLVDAREDEVAAARLRREVLALQSLRHPAVPRVLDAELDEDDRFVVFELVDGLTLFDHIQRHGPLAGGDLADFAERTASALEAVHAAGVIHRDVTPSNVMMGEDGPMLIDFGLAHRSDDARLTQEGLVSGTPGYVAPEVIDGAEPGPQADRWSWAATVGYAMAGHAPFGAGNGAISRTLEADPDLPDVAGATVLAAALGRETRERPGMRDVVAVLRGSTEVMPQLAATAVAPVGFMADPDATTVMSSAPPEPVHPVEEAWEDEVEDDAGEDTAHGYAPDDYPEEPLVVARPPRRPAMIALSAALLTVLAPLAPVVGWLVLVTLAIVSRGVYRRAVAIEGARTRRGAARTSDAVVHTLGLPWHILRGAAEAVPAILISAALGVGVAALSWWLVSEGLIAPLSAEGQYWGHAGAVAAGGLASIMGLMRGPYMQGTREGAHRIAAALSPSVGVRTAWILLALAGILVAVIALYLRVDVAWWPLPGVPGGA